MKPFNGLDKSRVQAIVRSSLKEDLGKGDVTTLATIDKNVNIKADIITQEEGVICGLPVSELIFNAVDYSVRIKPTVNEGDLVSPGKEIIYVEGRARSILQAERTVLNFLGHLSGIATKARQFTEKVKKHGVKIMDTRKTIPLLRYLEKYAVRVGGGHNHRMGLWDQILIKDNHIKIIKCTSGLALDKMPSVKTIVENAKRKKQRNILLEVEVTDLKEYKEALQAGPDIIMLDNMNIEDIKKAVELRPGTLKPELEASGGISLENVEEYAASGIDRISIGSLTKDVRALDMSLEVMG